MMPSPVPNPHRGPTLLQLKRLRRDHAIVAVIADGMTYGAAAEAFGVTKTTIFKALRRAGYTKPAT